RQHIETACRERGWQHVEVITCDVNTLELEADQFDRVVSVEMFEHMRNYQTLLNRISKWMKHDAKLFVHIFCHRYVMYPFETVGDDNWMGKYFFTGGIMPSSDTLLHFQKDLSIAQRWLVSGGHYEKTSNHWLANQDAHRDEIMAIMKATYGEADAKRWFNRWRMFWMACAELFGLEDGNEWLVAHYLFEKR
ncbi:MAG: class I SAM-dependent methyltransferase, partial [Arenimonas sp.]